MWPKSSSAKPRARTAAAESPPPTTDRPLTLLRAAATAFVPWEKASNSKTPIGPFQNTVRDCSIAEAKEDARNYSSQTKEHDNDPSREERDEANGAKQSSYKKKVLVGPKCNQIDFERIINSQINNDTEVEKQTTLMIRNIPIKFSQPDMLKLFDEKFQGQYNYFYLPKDLKT